MDGRLAVSLLLLLLSHLGLAPVLGQQDCLQVSDKWTFSSDPSVELTCNINGDRKLWRGTDRCSVSTFTTYNQTLINSRSFVVPRGDYDHEPVSIFCCSRGQDLVAASNQSVCYRIMMCPSATYGAPPVVVAGERETFYINHVAKPPTPTQPPSLSVTLVGDNLANSVVNVTSRNYSSAALSTTFIFSFYVPENIPPSTKVRFQAHITKGESDICTTDAHFSEVDVLPNDDGGSGPTQNIATGSTPKDDSTPATPCACPISVLKPGVVAVIVVVLVLAVCAICSFAVICTIVCTRRKAKEISSSSHNGVAQPTATPPRPLKHPSTLILRTPTENDRLISITSSNQTDTPITTKSLTNGHINGGLEVGGAPPLPSLTRSQRISPATPQSCRTLELPSPPVELAAPCDKEDEAPPLYETVQHNAPRRVDVYGGEHTEIAYCKQGNRLKLHPQHSETGDSSTKATLV